MCVWVRPHPYLLPDGRDLRSVSEEFRLPVPAAMIGELNMTAILITTVLYGIVIGLCTEGISQRTIEYVCHRKGLAGPDIDPSRRGALRIALPLTHIAACAAMGLLASRSLPTSTPLASMPMAQSLTGCMLLTTVIVAVWIELTINIIPNEFVLLTLLLGLAYRVLSGWLRGDVLSSLLGSLGAFMITLVLFVCAIISAHRASHGSSRGVGAGAFKLALALSVAVGFPGVVFFYLGVLSTVVIYFLFKLLTGSYSFLVEFPLAPFLLLGLLCGLACPYLLPAIWP